MGGGGEKNCPIWKPEELNHELVTDRKFQTWPGEKAGRKDQKKGVTPQRNIEALAYEKCIK